MTNQAAQTMPEFPEPEVHDAAGFRRAYTADQMRQYARNYAAALSQTARVPEGGPGDRGDMARAWLAVTETLDDVFPQWIESEKVGRECACDAIRFLAGRSRLAAAPAASGGEDGPNWRYTAVSALEYLEAGDTENAIGMLKSAISMHVPQPPAGASVSERARELLAAEYRTHGWHEDAGRLCMGGDPTSFVEDDALRVIDRLIEQGDEDDHVITELGRLLASIAVILKGPEPAGTAWSYHDLPGMVNRLKAERDSAPSLEQALAQPSDAQRARDDLHVAICQAVALMNMEPMTTAGLLQAHDILRKAIS